MNIPKKIVVLLVICSLSFENYAIFPLNFFRPWDLNLRPWYRCNKQLQTTGYYEYGIKARAYDSQRDQENVMQIWQENEDALAMLKGFGLDSLATQKLLALGNPIDNGVRGHLRVTGNMRMPVSAGFSAYWNLPHYVQLSAHLPVYAMSLRKVVFEDLTNALTPSDVLIKQQLTNDFVANIALLDPTLNLKGWNRVGVGDLAFMGEWHQGFRQDKPYLKNVELLLRTALTLPTGLSRNEDEILSVPFGYESTGLIFGGGIVLTWFDFLRGGIDFEILYLFGNNRTRRIKIQEDQTDFLFLAKAPTHKEYGITERYQLYLDTLPFWKGFSLGVAYQFWKHGKDKLDVLNSDFSTRIANTAQNLQEWSMHQLIFKLWYNSAPDGFGEGWDPQVLLFYKLPINGKRSIMFQTVGAALILSF